MRKKNYFENFTWQETILILLVAFVMMFGLLYKLGTLTSGYHFLDDHELIRMQVAFEDGRQSIGSTMKAWMTNDLSWRFRPFYWVERVILAFLFGSNMLYWNCYTAIKGVITFCLLYCTARYLKCNPVISALYTGLILYGAQFTPWYRSANQESTGLLLCALTMCLIAAQAHYKRYQSIPYNLFIVISAILCGLVKESFMLMMPAFMAMKFWMEYQENPQKKLWECLKSNWITYGIIGVAFLTDVLVLLFGVGVDQVSYAGFHTETSVAEYWQGIVISYKYYLRWYVDAALVLMVLLIIGAGKKNWKKYWGYGLIGGYVLVVQLVAHAKSGMWERYIIPWIVGYSAVFVILGFKMLQHTKICIWIYFMILCGVLYIEAPITLSKCRDYTYQGQMTAVFFRSILDNTDENSQIISAFYDGELNLATECWLEAHERTQVYSYNAETGTLFNYVQIRGNEPADLNWYNAKVVTCYAYQVEEMLQNLGLSNSEQYAVKEYAGYAVIIIDSV